jgi:MoaA/NifB/PqqE/SkfB family radical SAM enzyme
MNELSITLKNGNKCNMNCKYCSGELAEDNITIDYNKMEETIRSISWIDSLLDGGTVNVWGGEPLLKFDKCLEIFQWFKRTFSDKVSCFVSTNGLLLRDNDIVDKIIEHDIKIQISHDGLGQSYRSGPFDPFYDPSTKDNIIKLAKNGNFFLINATLHKYNYKIIDNINYFNEWRFSNNIQDLNIEIKLNHMHDSLDSEEWNFDEGPELDQYMHELEVLMIKSLVTDPKDDLVLGPYLGYFKNQAERYNNYDPKSPGGCASYSMGLRNEAWVVNTLGEFVGCQLFSNHSEIPNPKCERPDYCNDCEYSDKAECHPCPIVVFPTKCVYRKAYIRLVERMQVVIGAINTVKNNSNKPKGDNCNCDCKPSQEVK